MVGHFLKAERRHLQQPVVCRGQQALHSGKSATIAEFSGKRRSSHCPEKGGGSNHSLADTRECSLEQAFSTSTFCWSSGGFGSKMLQRHQLSLILLYTCTSAEFGCKSMHMDRASRSRRVSCGCLSRSLGILPPAIRRTSSPQRGTRLQKRLS